MFKAYKKRRLQEKAEYLAGMYLSAGFTPRQARQVAMEEGKNAALISQTVLVMKAASLDKARRAQLPGAPDWGTHIHDAVPDPEAERKECSDAWVEAHKILCGKLFCLKHENPYKS